MPILSTISPTESGLKGAIVKVTGQNIEAGADVLFGEAKGLNPSFSKNTQVTVNAPAVSAAAVVDVVLSNEAGTRNAIKYSYVGDTLR